MPHRPTLPGLNCSAVILVIAMPTPSINANKTAPTAAAWIADEGPPAAKKNVMYHMILCITKLGSSMNV